MAGNQDIKNLETRIKELEAELASQKQNEQLLSKVVQQSIYSVAIVDVEGNLIYANPKLLSAYGLDIDNVMDQNWRDFISGDSTLPDHLEEMTETVLIKGETWRNEISDQSVTGEPIWRNSTISPIKASDGTITHILYTSEDITSRKNAEEALRSSEKKFRELVENIDEVFYILDTDGRFTYVSPMMEKLFGYEPSELINTFSSKLIYKNDRPAIIKEFQELGSGVRKPSEYRLVNKTGALRWVISHTRPIFENGKLVELRGLLSDITEQKRSQEIMIQTEKMMSIGGLAGGMAHEINNPLGAILQSLQMIVRRLAPNDPKNIKAAEKYGIDLDKLQAFFEDRHISNFLDGIKASGERAANIVANMLKFTRRSESKLAPTDIADLLERTVEMANSDFDLKNQYDFRNIEIIKEFDPEIPYISCTRIEIEQVVLNLLVNAAQSITEKTDCAQPRIILRTRKEKDYVRIEIEDNGQGMDEAVQRRIFEPFFTTKEEGTGTGLGLSVSYMIITKHHQGHIEVESEPNKGSTFIIQLPLNKTSS